jgi:putative transposase
MALLSYRRHRFPPPIIQHAIWLYLRFTLSYRDVEDLLAERGLDLSYETVRRWVLKFGPLIARRLRRSRPRPSNRWHLDEMVVRIAGKAHVPLACPSITKARCSTCWCSAGATAGRRCG